MKIFLSFFIIAFSFLFFYSCNSPSNEEETEDTTEEVNEESINQSVPEDVAEEFNEGQEEFVVEAYSFNIMLLDYGEVALEKENIPNPVKEFAQASVSFHKEPNEQLEAIALENNIYLPKGEGENVAEFSEQLRGLEGAEFADDYIDVVSDIQDKMISGYQEAIDSEYGQEIQTYAGEALPIMNQRKELVSELEEYTNEIE